MVRDSNPRTSCPVSGFQDRRIRPLCQPSETFIRATLLQTGGFGAAYDFIILAPRFAVKTSLFDLRCQPSEFTRCILQCFFQKRNVFYLTFDKNIYKIRPQSSGVVAQLIRAPDLHSGGRGFESHQLHQDKTPIKNA